MPRLFLDSNVIIDGVISSWSASRVTLALCAKKLHRAVIASYVIREVEDALVELARRKPSPEAERSINDYLKFIEISRPEIIVLEDGAPEMRQASFIHHVHDIPVLAAAIKAKPDWLLTRNRNHFNDDVAARTGLRIATPDHFLRQMSQS